MAGREGASRPDDYQQPKGVPADLTGWTTWDVFIGCVVNGPTPASVIEGMIGFVDEKTE
jgi:hypothetical protein